jgi:hypothetical protein
LCISVSIKLSDDHGGGGDDCRLIQKPQRQGRAAGGLCQISRHDQGHGIVGHCRETSAQEINGGRELGTQIGGLFGGKSRTTIRDLIVQDEAPAELLRKP